MTLILFRKDSLENQRIDKKYTDPPRKCGLIKDKDDGIYWDYKN